MKYIKNGKECYLCYSRKKLIFATPEEKVRQAFIETLINDYNVPENLIEVEVPMSRFHKSYKGRADILVYDYDNNPLILIECKQLNYPITDNVIEQAWNYDEVLKVQLIIITNGIETLHLMYDYDEEIYYTPRQNPKFHNLIDNIEFEKFVDDYQWERPDHMQFSPLKVNNLKDEGIIGEDSQHIYHSFFINLYGLLLDDSKKIKELDITPIKFISDEGIRYTTFGNSAGGGFTGLYRYIILEDENGENQIVSLSIMGKISAKNHPRFGNSKGYTLFLVAIDDMENSHLSLELSIDRFTEIHKTTYKIFHDGTLTIGNKGRAKNIDVINFIKEKSPDLIMDGKVLLGTLDNSFPFTWKRNDVSAFISNIIKYSLLRDEFRKQKKSEYIVLP